MYIIIALIASLIGLGLGISFGRWGYVAPLLFGIASASAFGAIDALFFLTAEKELDDQFADWGIPAELIPLIVGAISASISLFMANYLRHYLGKRFNIMESPLLDVVGIATGTFIICACYILYLRWKASRGGVLTIQQQKALRIKQ